jgi:hypothetical protein
MKRKIFNRSFAESDWRKVQDQARAAMISSARNRRTISYSDLVQAIRAISVEPNDARLSHLLGEIASEEKEAGRGMLTVAVVHKNGDQMPGPDFFEMAKVLGRDILNREEFWIKELKAVQAAWQ